MNLIRIWVITFLLAMFGVAHADTDSTAHTVADIKTELIKQMGTDGVFDNKLTEQYTSKYVTADDAKLQVSVPEESLLSKLFSWSNFLKVVGIILLLVAFSGIIKNIIIALWVVIASIPVVIYQGAMLSVTVTGLLNPSLFWASQAFYVALFCAFANIILLVWVLDSYPKIMAVVMNLFTFKLPVETLASFYGMLYFGALALYYHSSIFGFFAVVCLSGLFSFTMRYVPGVLFLDFKENMLKLVVFGHLIVLGLYVNVFMTKPEYVEYFNVGFQYYCTIGLGVGLLVAASPFYKREAAVGYAILFTAIAATAMYGYFFYDLKVIGSIMACFYVLFMLEWIGYIGFTGGLIFGSMLTGGTLYGLAMLFETYGSMVILSMPK